MRKTNKMDKLATDAMMARNAGMSYGKWKALHPDEEPYKKPVPKNAVECAWCRTMFFRTNPNQKYCSPECADNARRAANERWAERRTLANDYR